MKINSQGVTMKNTVHFTRRGGYSKFCTVFLSIVFVISLISCQNDVEDTSYQLLDISAAQSTTAANVVTVTWRDSVEASKYYIYYNTTNDSSTATKYSSYAYVTEEYDSKYQKTGYYKGSKDIPLSTSGTYYFWLKSFDGSNQESDFSKSASIEFTVQ